MSAPEDDPRDESLDDDRADALFSGSLLSPAERRQLARLKPWKGLRLPPAPPGANTVRIDLLTDILDPEPIDPNNPINDPKERSMHGSPEATPAERGRQIHQSIADSLKSTQDERNRREARAASTLNAVRPALPNWVDRLCWIAATGVSLVAVAGVIAGLTPARFLGVVLAEVAIAVLLTIIGARSRARARAYRDVFEAAKEVARSAAQQAEHELLLGHVLGIRALSQRTNDQVLALGARLRSEVIVPLASLLEAKAPVLAIDARTTDMDATLHAVLNGLEEVHDLMIGGATEGDDPTEAEPEPEEQAGREPE